MKRATNCCTGDCLQGRDCPMRPQPDSPKNNGWAWWVAAALVAVGGFLLIVSYEPATGLDSSIVWSK